MPKTARCMNQNTIAIIHRGGLGDFLLAWPSMFSICKYFSTSDRFWVGAGNRLPWLEPFGARACAGEERLAFDALFATSPWPEPLAHTRLYWFVLGKPPPVQKHPNLILLRGLQEAACVSVRQAYAEALRISGIPFDPGWLDAWRFHFGRYAQSGRAKGRGKRVLLFPGAGHPVKQWPLVQFFELAAWLGNQGVDARFVLGPAEVDRGMRIADFPMLFPSSPQELQDLLLSADVVVGNDSGPMHLAGMLGIPGVALFGPTAARQWAPLGLRLLCADAPCRPCTANGQIDCLDARCMATIGQRGVRREVAALLANGEIL